MFMTPHHQVNEVVQELLWDVVSGSMLTPREINVKCKGNEAEPE